MPPLDPAHIKHTEFALDSFATQYLAPHRLAFLANNFAFCACFSSWIIVNFIWTYFYQLPQHLRFILVLMVCTCLILIERTLKQKIKKDRDSATKSELAQGNYLATWGTITQIEKWQMKKKTLTVWIEYLDLQQQLQQKKFYLPYPDSTISSKLPPLDPQQLQGQRVKLCLSTDSHTLLQLSMYAITPEKLHFCQLRTFLKRPLFNLHQEGILSEHVLDPFDVNAIYFIPNSELSNFELYFQCGDGVYISSQIQHFSALEQVLEAQFPSFNWQHYEKLKQGFLHHRTQLWQREHLLSNTEKHRLRKQAEYKIGSITLLWFLFATLLLAGILWLNMMPPISAIFCYISSILFILVYQRHVFLRQTNNAEHTPSEPWVRL